MRHSTKSIARGIVAVAALLGVGAPVARADGGSQVLPPVKVVASQLAGPFGLGAGTRRLFVAETGDGQITRINPRNGRTKVVARRLLNLLGSTASAGCWRS